MTPLEVFSRHVDNTLQGQLECEGIGIDMMFTQSTVLCG